MTAVDERSAEFRTTVRRVVQDRAPIASARAAYDSGAGIDADLWRHLRDLGALGLHVPEELGGSGGGHSEVAIVAAELGAVLARVPYLVSTGVAASVLLGLPDRNEMVTDTLGRIALGATVATVALWEPGTSAWNPGATTLRLTGSGVSGRKIAVPFAGDADVALAFARSDSGSLALVLADLTRPGVRIEPTTAFDRTVPLSTIDFTDARVMVVTRDAAAAHAVDATTNLGAVHRANESVAGAQACLDAAVAYSLQRVQFGRLIGSQQAIKHLCADVLVDIELARGAVAEATGRLGELGADVDAVASLAKALASQTYLFAADAALHIHGGMGFTWEHASHLFLRRARAASLDFGDVAFHQDRFLATSHLTRPTQKGQQ